MKDMYVANAGNQNQQNTDVFSFNEVWSKRNRKK
jgi:hypothetical protein